MPTTLRLWSIALALACAAIGHTCAAEGDEPPAPKQSFSPDHHFVFCTKPTGYEVVEVASGRVVTSEDGATEEALDDQSRAVWAADSRRLAVNSRVGVRFEITTLYANGEKFGLWPNIDHLLGMHLELLEKRIDRERTAEIKRLKLPANVYLRRIWDSYRTVRWRDARTVDIKVNSDRHCIPKDEEGGDIIIDATYTVRFEKGGPRIIARNPPPEEKKPKKKGS